MNEWMNKWMNEWMNGYCALREYGSDPYIAGINILHPYIAHHPVGKLPISAKLKSHLQCFLSCGTVPGCLLVFYSGAFLKYLSPFLVKPLGHKILGQPVVTCSN